MKNEKVQKKLAIFAVFLLCLAFVASHPHKHTTHASYVSVPDYTFAYHSVSVYVP